MNRKKAIISIILNSIIIVATFVSVLNYFVEIFNKANMDSAGVNCFRYFTIDSNILCSITSIFMIIKAARYLNNQFSPKWFTVLKFVGTCAVMLTFMTVACILYPFNTYLGLKFFYGGSGFSLHFFNPVLALISLVFFEKYENVSKISILYSIIPMFIYGIFYIINVWFNKTWNDFYGLTFGYKYIILPSIGMILFQFIISILVYLCTKIKLKNQLK